MKLSSIFPGVKMFDSFLHPERGYQKAQEQLSQYYNQGQAHFQPYAQQGQEAYGQLGNAMKSLLNPSQLNDQFMNQYQQSDAAKFAQQRALNSGLSAAQAMGLGGASTTMQGLQAQGSEIAAQDEQRFLDRMIQQYLQGAGLAQNIYGHGANASSMMGQNAMNMGQMSGQTAYGAQNAPGELFGKLLGSAVGIAFPAYGNSNLAGTPPINPAGGNSPQAPSPWNIMGGS